MSKKHPIQSNGLSAASLKKSLVQKDKTGELMQIHVVIIYFKTLEDHVKNLCVTFQKLYTTRCATNHQTTQLG